MPVLRFDQGTLLLSGISAPSLARVADAATWVRDERVSQWRCDAHSYADVIRRLREARFHLTDEVPAWEPVRWSPPDLHPLRDDQLAAQRAWMETQRGCVVMPTGTGKTEVALTIMADTAVSTLVVAPIRDLMYQWHRRILAGLGYDAGIVGDNVFRVRPVSVTTYDSAYLHMDKLGNRFGLIVFDECHHLPGPVRRDAARMSAAPMRLGLTATLERSDGRHDDLKWLIGPTCFEQSVTAVKGRVLADYEVVRIPVHLSPDEQAHYDRLSRTVRAYVAQRRKTNPKFRWEDIYADTGKLPEARRALNAYHAKKSVEDRAAEKLRVLEDIFRLHAGEPCLVFAGSNAMARDVSLRFLIPCLLNHCRKRERQDVLQGLEEGRYPALVANQVLDEGVDLPDVKVAVVIGGSASTRQAKQRLGRVLRKSGNARARLYEVVCTDTNEEHRSRRRRKSDAYQGTRHRRV